MPTKNIDIAAPIAFHLIAFTGEMFRSDKAPTKRGEINVAIAKELNANVRMDSRLWAWSIMLMGTIHIAMAPATEKIGPQAQACVINPLA